LSSNQNAIDLLSANLHKINWKNLCHNSSAAGLLAQHPSKIEWSYLCRLESWIEHVI
jgi:hypothetical protein